jgi:hypothetical protein
MTLIDRAEALFERHVGYKIRLDTYTKTFHYDDNGAVIRSDNVVEILSIRAKSSSWMYENFFGNTDWRDIDLEHVVTHERDGFLYVNLPPTLFGTAYTEVEITYVAGHERIPDDMIGAILEIERLLKDGTITEWNCILPVHVLDVINKYRKEVID